MGSIGMPELLIILVIALVIFGAGKLPQIGQDLGRAIRSFKDSVNDREETHRIPKNPGSSVEGHGQRHS